MSDFGKGDTGWFVHDRFGMFIHWGLYSMPGRHEWIRHYEEIPNEAYEKYFERFGYGDTLVGGSDECRAVIDVDYIMQN